MDRSAWPDWMRYADRAGLRDLDLALGRLLLECDPQADELGLRLAALCSARLAQGHACLDLAALYERPGATLPEDWLLAADSSHPSWLPADLAGCVRRLGRLSFVGAGEGDEPLVLREHRLYLSRYWRAARRIRESITRRLQWPTEEADAGDAAAHWLDRLFPPRPDRAPDWQKIACATALLSAFSIITGGPGTGKTTTVVRLLTVLQGLARERGLVSGLRICLAAPTGKAAARLNESIRGALARLRRDAPPALAAALDCVPTEVTTLHRLLGSRPDTRRLAYHAGRPLDLEVLVVDEASMMDIEMMDAVLAAVPEQARLVLLGDKDQLASVEAGAVLGELCARAEAGHYLPDRCADLARLCGHAPGVQWRDPRGTLLDQSVVMLRHSHRFSAASGIGRLAGLINQGRADAVLDLLRQPPEGLSLIFAGAAPNPPREPAAGDDIGAAPVDWLRACGALAEPGYPALFALMRRTCPADDAPHETWDAWALDVLAQQARFQMLCAVREGPWGAHGLNQAVETHLEASGRLQRSSGPWYPGRPVLVRRNLPALGLANGDIGVALSVPDPLRAGRRRIRVAFADGRPGRVRWVSPVRLPQIDTVYALTVHKSQGSEFDRVVLVLPDRPGPLLTRELLYTGVTRARSSLTLVLPGPATLLTAAIHHRTERAGGVWQN